MEALIKPHTPEWFAALEKVNPMQAAQTKQMLKLAGRDDVCSVCGDDPASDFKLESSQMNHGFVSTLRLCADCLGIRRSMHRENYVPLNN